MRILRSVLPLVAVLAAPAMMHADNINFNGQFSIGGDLYQTTPNEFTFADAYVGKATGQTGTFSTLLTPGDNLAGSSTITYSPYTPGSSVFTVDGLTINLQSFLQNNPGMFTGTAILSATGYNNAMANLLFTTQTTGTPTVTVTFSSTVATSPVPEPSTLALLGTGGLGVAGAIRRRFRA